MVALPRDLFHFDPGCLAGPGRRKCHCAFHLYAVLIMISKRSKYRETLLVIVLGFSLLYILLDRDWMLYLALITGILGMLSLTLNRWIHQAWFFLGEKMGWVVSKIVLGTLYIVILLPVSLFAGIFRKEVMNLKTPEKSGYHRRNHLYCAEDLENMW